MQWRPVRRASGARPVSRRLTRRAFIAYCAVPVGCRACWLPAPEHARAASDPRRRSRQVADPGADPDAPAPARGRRCQPTAAAAAAAKPPNDSPPPPPRPEQPYPSPTRPHPRPGSIPRRTRPRSRRTTSPTRCTTRWSSTCPGKTFAPSLAESYEIAPDIKSATFKLRQGIKFHDGSPVTPEDVKFTYEKYRGANASILKEKTATIETPDDRTVKFVFKEPFLDFLTIYGSPSSGAGWIVPKAYYEKVGPNGFKQTPIGAGPYRFVKQQAGTEIEFEAFTEYWRKVAERQDDRHAGHPRGGDPPGDAPDRRGRRRQPDPGRPAGDHAQGRQPAAGPAARGPAWLEPMSFDGRTARSRTSGSGRPLSLAIDRKAFSDAEMGGLAAMEGNWIPEDWPGALKRDRCRRPTSPRRSSSWPTRAWRTGFEVSQITPLPPYTSLAERIVGPAPGDRRQDQGQHDGAGRLLRRAQAGPDRLKGF